MTKPLVRGTLILYSSSRSTAWQTKNKMLSYRRETALQGALVLAKSGRLKLGDDILRTYRSIFDHCDIIGLQNYQIQWTKRKIRAITPFKIIQSHRGRYQSKAKCATSYKWLIVTDIHLVAFQSYQSLLFKFWTLHFWAPLWRALGQRTMFMGSFESA